MKIASLFADKKLTWDFVRRLNNNRHPLVFLFARDFYLEKKELPTPIQVSNALGVSIQRAKNSIVEITTKAEAL